MKYKIVSILKLKLIVALLSLAFINANAQCNGAIELCDKKYNEVAYLTTHNAFNSTEDNFNLPNQNLNITSQLNDGVRGLMIDVYEKDGAISVYHSVPSLGIAPFVDYLMDIKNFLESNPNEIVSIILECYVDADAIEGTIKEAGLENYLYAHNAEAGWKTLQEMIDNDERLVILSDKNDATEGQAWYHYVWNWAVETPFSIGNWQEFNCDYLRGEAENDLFILNHFITDTASYVGSPTDAELINEYYFLSNRAYQCMQENDKFPNFITVDFYELGDCMKVVNELNGVTTLSVNEISFSNLVSVYPNPSNDFVIVENEFIDRKNVSIYSVLGEKINVQNISNQVSDSKLRLDISGLNTGIYFIKANDKTHRLYKE